MNAYPLSDYDGSGYKAVEAIVGDYLFVCPAQFIVEATIEQNSLQQKTFMYLFNHTPSWSIPFVGPYHGAEVSISSITLINIKLILFLD